MGLQENNVSVNSPLNRRICGSVRSRDWNIVGLFRSDLSTIFEQDLATGLLLQQELLGSIKPNKVRIKTRLVRSTMFNLRLNSRALRIDTKDDGIAFLFLC